MGVGLERGAGMSVRRQPPQGQDGAFQAGKTPWDRTWIRKGESWARAPPDTYSPWVRGTKVVREEPAVRMRWG